MILRYDRFTDCSECDTCGGNTDEYVNIFIDDTVIYSYSKTGCFGDYRSTEGTLPDAIMSYFENLNFSTEFKEELNKQFYNTRAYLLYISAIFLEHYGIIFEIEVNDE